jgi:HK97 family phage prohead protease
MGDRIAVNGWELGQYRRNPVVLWAHDANAPPIARMPRIFPSGDKLLGGVKFASADVYSFADTIYRLVVGGFISAGSVGFTPIDFKFSSDPDRPMGIDFKRQELLEFSICPIPANANTLVDGRSYRSRRSADDPIAELGRAIGQMIRAAGQRNAPSTASLTQWERVEKARLLRARFDGPAAVVRELRRQILG